MGNSISLEENENEDQSIQNSGDIEMKSSESGDNSSNNDNDLPPPTTVKRSKRGLSDAVKKRRSTSKNGNAGALKKTKSVRRR